MGVNEHWEITERSEGCLFLKDPAGWWRADVRFDGCIHLCDFFNEPWDGTEAGFSRANANDYVDYMHICDVEQHIERLQELVRLAREYFGDWPC